MSQSNDAQKTFMQKILDVVEKVGNKVPHPAIIFLTLIAIVIVLSALFGWLGTSFTYEVLVPKAQKVEAQYDPGVHDAGPTMYAKEVKEKTPAADAGVSLKMSARSLRSRPSRTPQ